MKTALVGAILPLASALIGAGVAPLDAQDGSQRFADLGACRLESGAEIRPCRVGYRTLGELDATRSNAVVVPSWFAGTSEQLGGFIRPGGLVDPERFFVIIVDALGNGVSSSPSNAPPHGGAFPRFEIGDMVESQRRLLLEHLEIETLAGVVGISMGGMQAFEWIVRHPEMVGAAVAIAATPRAGAYDRIAWDVYLRLLGLLETDASRQAAAVLADFEYLRGTSPAFVNRSVSADSVAEVLAGLAAERLTAAEIVDRAAQARAVSVFDVSDGYGGSLERAAGRVRARLTVIVTESDHQVTPHASIDFAALAGGTLLLLENDCGHAGANCEGRRALTAVAATLEGRPVSSAPEGR